MNEKKLYRYMLPTALSVAFLILLLLSPSNGRTGAAYGLTLCSNIVIPSLFPFAVCVLFIMRSGILSVLGRIEPVTRFLFGQSGGEFSAFLLSLIGGYPVGGRLIKELYDNGHTNKKRAHILQCCCTNAGPAFIVIAVGGGILGSKALGYILLLSSTLSSVIMAIICGFFLRKEKYKKATQIVAPPDIADNFVTSTADAAASVFGICAYVLLFSVINQYLGTSPVRIITEVTTAVTITKNIYLIAFIIGFSGICVWLQLYSVSGKLGISLPIFALSRLLHGSLSTALTYLLILIFKPTLPTISNNITFKGGAVIDTVSLGISLIIMGILFCIATANKNNSRNLLRDMI